MVFAVLPVFLIDVLGVSYTQAGLMEGVAISVSFLSKVFSGVISDMVRRRRPLIALGSLLSVLVKLFYVMSHTFTLVFLARFMDRLSKGVRSSPTDALIADLSQQSDQGRNFGLRQSLYTLGAVVGAGMSMLLMRLHNDHYRLIFAISMIPALIALYIVVMVVRQPVIKNDIQKKTVAWRPQDLRHLPLTFWGILGISFVLMLARFSESFITYRAKSLGWPVALLPLIIIIMDIFHAALAYPIGRLADKWPRRRMLMAGIPFLVIANLFFIFLGNCWGVFWGIVVNGIHMGMTQGVLAALIAESSPAELRGTAFSMFYLTTGTAVLIGNTLAGHLCDLYGTGGAFFGGFLFSSLSIVLLMLFVYRQEKNQAREGA